MAAANRFCRLSLTPFEDRLTPSITLLGDGVSSQHLEADQRITRETKIEAIKPIPAGDVTLAGVDLNESSQTQARPGREIKTVQIKPVPASDVSLDIQSFESNEANATEAQQGARRGDKPNPWSTTDKRDYPESVIHSTM